MTVSKILYLGLRPKENVVHYPVIRTVFCADLSSIPLLWPQVTHLLFTSRTAVEYWPGPWDRKILAIGEPTAQALWEKGQASLIAPTADQEGMMELIETVVKKEKSAPYFFWPHSRRSRPDLRHFLKRCGLAYHALPLYDTLLQEPLPRPDLTQFEEIIFTSPSTVEGFLRIFHTFPSHAKLSCIGPVTKRALAKNIQNRDTRSKRS